MAVYVKKYNGSAWVDAAVKRYNGSAWVDATVNKWDGSKWVQLYPEVAVSTTETITGSSTTWTYRNSKYKNWKQEDAKQGDGSSYSDGDSHNFGFLNLSSSKFAGYKNVNSVSSAKYTAVRGGAGTYNTNQTIKFYRSNVVASSSAATPSGTCSGLFTTTTGGPGSGGTMSNRTIASDTLSNCLSWMNAVDSKPQLYIASSTAADYLSIKGASKMTATYVYMAKMAVFTNANEPMLINLNRLTNMSESEVYHKMVIYPHEENMTLAEIIANREEKNLEEITYDSIIEGYKKQIVTSGSSIVDNKIKVNLNYLTDEHIPEYSIDNETFYPLISNEIDTYVGELPKEFNKNKHNVYIRVVNKVKDCIDFEYVKEPLFLIL